MIAFEQLGSGSVMVAMHGILGRRSNWRSLMRRSVAGQRGDAGALLVDLREHGESVGSESPPHTVAACAMDVLSLHQQLESAPVAALGHSFGGKVAISYAHHRLKSQPLTSLFVIDSSPGVREFKSGKQSDSVTGIVAALKSVPTEFDSRKSFVAAIREHQQISDGVGQWLAMNLVRDGKKFRLGIDPLAIESLLCDYASLDLWSELKEISEDTQVHVILGGTSTAVSSDDKGRFAELSAAQERFSVSVVPDVGHWVHAEAPDAVLELLGNWS